MKQQPSRVKKNWLKLKNILLSGTLANKNKQSKFNLFDKHTTHMDKFILTTYSHEPYKFVQKCPQPIYKQLLHFQSQVDATGKWVWEAQEIAAYFFIIQGESIINKTKGDGNISILQLGAGSSGLASIALAQVAINHFKGENVMVELTDGQIDNIEYLVSNLKENLSESCICKANRLLWGDEQCLSNLTQSKQQRKTFNFIIVCDCLYFTNFHKELVITIESYLSKEGSVYLINPSRGDSMILFLSTAQQRGFRYEFIDFSDAKYVSELNRVRKVKDFIEDKNCPYFIRLWRKNI